MKVDTLFFITSNFSRYFNFSPKNDPFLVFPASKHSAVGGGVLALKKIKSADKTA